MNRFFDSLKTMVDSRLFRNFVFAIILLSAVIVGLETYPAVALKYRTLLHTADRMIVALFTLEIVLKIAANGKRPWHYFSDPWNIFDFIIVAVCLIPLNDTHFFAVLRIFRVMRILRMIPALPKLRLIISTLLKSIPSMGYIMMLIGLLFYVYSIIGVFIFGPTDPTHFGDLHHAAVTLFKVLTLEGWTDIMNVHILGTNESGTPQIVSLWPFLYFASFILIGAMIVMNLFIGVIMNNMEESQNELAQELKNHAYKDVNTEALYRHIISKLDDLNQEIRTLKKTKNADQGM